MVRNTPGRRSGESFAVGLEQELDKDLVKQVKAVGDFAEVSASCD